MLRQVLAHAPKATGQKRYRLSIPNSSVAITKHTWVQVQANTIDASTDAMNIEGEYAIRGTVCKRLLYVQMI